MCPQPTHPSAASVPGWSPVAPHTPPDGGVPQGAAHCCSPSTQGFQLRTVPIALLRRGDLGAPKYSPHPQPAPPSLLLRPYEGHVIVHRTTPCAAKAKSLLAAARLSTAKKHVYLCMAFFWSTLGILSALRAMQSGERMPNVLMAHAGRWEAEGPAWQRDLVGRVAPSL